MPVENTPDTAPDYAQDPGQPTLPGPDDEKLEIEVVDDTPEADRGRPQRTQPTEKIAGEEADDDKYGDEAKARMKRLRYVYHEERRGREAAERQINEAIEYGKRVIAENQQLRQQNATGERVLIGEAIRRAEAQVEHARTLLLAAHEAGDSAGLVKAQEQMARAISEHQRLQQYVPATPTPEQQAQQAVQQPQQYPPPQPQQQQIPPQKLDPGTQDWIKRNAWFGQPGYEEQTSIAMAVHARLTANGIGPLGETAEEYWTAIDSRLNQLFPEQFGSAQGKATGQRGTPNPQQNGRAPGARSAPHPAARPPVFAGGSKASSNGPVKVRLTQSQVDVARRLGITPEQYAREYVKMQTP